MIAFRNRSFLPPPPLRLRVNLFSSLSSGVVCRQTVDVHRSTQVPSSSTTTESPWSTFSLPFLRGRVWANRRREDSERTLRTARHNKQSAHVFIFATDSRTGKTRWSLRQSDLEVYVPLFQGGEDALLIPTKGTLSPSAFSKLVVSLATSWVP